MGLNYAEHLPPALLRCCYTGVGLFYSEFMLNAALFHYCVGRKAGFYLSIYRDMAFCDGAVPNIVIAFSVPDIIAAVLLQEESDFLLILRH